MQVLPLTFTYDKETQQLEVEFCDGSVIRYFDLEPTLAFLSPTNSGRNRDFLDYLSRVSVRSEVIQQPTKTMGVPQTRPQVALEQSQRGNYAPGRAPAPWFK